MSDIEFVQQCFKVDASKAKELIDKGLNIEFLRNGFKDIVVNELEEATKKFKEKVEKINEENKNS